MDRFRKCFLNNETKREKTRKDEKRREKTRKTRKNEKNEEKREKSEKKREKAGQKKIRSEREIAVNGIKKKVQHLYKKHIQN